MTKRIMTNNDLQNIAQKTKDRATRTPLKTVWYSNDGTYNEPILAIIAPQSVECKLEAGSWGVAYEP